MKNRITGAAALLLIAGCALLAPPLARAQLLPPLPGGSLIVTVTSPSQGSTVSGTIPVSASVSIVGSLTVSRVEFFRDGNFIGSDSGAPYSVSWDTRTVGNGSHSLVAVGVDVLGVRWNSNSVTVTASNDTTRPTVTINQAAGQADPANAAPINFTVVFSEPVSGFTGTDVTISGTAGGTKTRTVTGGPSTYNVAVSGMTSSGTVIATIAAGVAQDAAGNTNTASTSSDSSVQFNLPDTTRPTVTINQAAAQADPTSSSPINFTVVFSEAVSGFSNTDVAITGTAGGTKTVAVSGGPSTYTVAVSGMTSSGTVIATIAAGVAQDAAGNTNTASTSSDSSVQFNLPAPTITGFTPTTGPAGTIVTITGTNFTGATAVTFNAVGAGFVVDSATSIRTEVPAGATTGPIRVTTPGGSATSSTSFTVEASPPTVTRFEEDNAAVAFSPDSTGNLQWRKLCSEIANFSGGCAGGSDVAGATATFTFTGTAVSWIGLKCNVCGIATVSIDGGAPVTVDTAGPLPPGDPALTSPARQPEVVFTASGLTAGATHTLVITVTGEFTAPSGGAFVIVDALDVTTGGTGSTVATGSAVNRIEETSPALSVTGGWVLRGPEIAAFSPGGTGQASSSNVAGATATLTFTGTAVSWIGLKCSVCGIATVSLDGSPLGEINTAGPADVGSPGLVSGPVFTASGLAAGTHTLVITVTGATTSGDAHIAIDAFDVTP